MCCACIDGSAQATRSKIGRDPPPTLLNKLECVGTETNLTQCPEDKGQCITPGAGIICPVQNGKLYVAI